MNTGRVRIGISGSYGGLNLGDEAILQAIITELRRDVPGVELVVFSRNAGDTRQRHSVEHAVDTRRISRSEARSIVSELDLLILGGGGILFDDDAEHYVREVFLAIETNTPVLVYAISVGPLTMRRTRELVRDALQHVTVLTVRERHSQQLLDDIGVLQRAELVADPALLIAPEPLSLDVILRNEAIDPDATLIAFSVREPGPAAPDLEVAKYHQLIANTADYLVDRLDAEVVFFPLERHVSDVQHSHGVVAQMRHAHCATVLRREYRPGQLVSLLQHFDFAIGMRLHFLIFSALADLPMVALPYASKVRGFLDELGIGGPAVQETSAGQLIAHVDRTWDFRDAQRAHIQCALPHLQRKARIPNEHAVRLLPRKAEPMPEREREA
jgi:polysaccharide pyruvyl transferase CsaB